MRGAAGKTPVWFAWILAVLLLISGGVAYRVSGHKLKLLVEKPTMLPVPLGDFPIQVGNWVGSEMPIPATTKEYMERNFADDFYLYKQNRMDCFRLLLISEKVSFRI